MPTTFRVPRSARFWELSALAAIVLFGVWVRLPGFSRASPWFDDAWVILSSKVGLSSAMHMVNTTPLFSLGMRSWILLHPHSLWWDQIPVFVMGLLAIVAVFALLRFFKVWRPLALFAALVIAASPIVITYSTRVKQYNLDILLACAVFFLFERWRREPGWRSVLSLTVVSVLALLISAETLIAIAPAVMAAVYSAWVQRERLRQALVFVSSVFSVLAIEYFIWLRHLSKGLDLGWTGRGYMLSFKSRHFFVFSLETMGSQFFHWMLGIPTGHAVNSITATGLIVAALSAIVVAAVSVPVVVQQLRHRRELPGPFFMAALSVVLAVVLGLMAIVPFGGGRTDEVLYPAVLLLVAGVVTRLSQRPIRHISAILMVTTLLASGAMLFVGNRNRAPYPTIGLTSLYARLRPHVTAHQFVVVDPWLSFTWGADGLTPTSISFTREYFDWSQGFHVVSNDSKVIISNQYFFPDAQLGGLSHYAHQLWYIAEAGSLAWPRTSPGDQQYWTRDYGALVAAGWKKTTTRLLGPHVVAILVVYAPLTK